MISGRALFKPVGGFARINQVLAGLILLSCLVPASARAQSTDPLSSVLPSSEEAAPDFLDVALQGTSNVMLVVDSSGSMSTAWDDETSRYEAAKAALTGLATDLPPQTRTGVVTFGHRRNFDCADIEVLSNPVADASVLGRVLSQQRPPDRGMRPLADAIETAAARLSQQPGPGAVIVVTDGAEECGGNSCALAGPLAQLDIPVHIIGLGMKASEAALLRCLPSNTAGSFTNLKPGQSLRDPLAQALAKAHTANAQRSAATLARLLLQEQDIALRDLTRVRSDITRLDAAILALDDKVEGLAERDVLTEELQPRSGPRLENELAVIGEAAARLQAQLASRDQMLIRLQEETGDWNAGTLGLSRQAKLADAMTALSETVAEPAERLQLGYERLVDRRAALETEIAAASALSMDLHGRLETLKEDMQQVGERLDSAQALAARLESGEGIEAGTLEPPLRETPALAAVLDRDKVIADLRLERDDLRDQLQSLRAALAVSQEDVLRVEKQRALAETRVQEARTLLSSLQSNQRALQSNWTTEMDRQSRQAGRAQGVLQTRLDAVLADQAALRVELAAARSTILRLEADNLSLMARKDEAEATGRDGALALDQAESRQAALATSLSQCRLHQQDLSRHIVALKADVDAARVLAAQQAPDRVRLLLAEGVEIGDAEARWSIEDPLTGATLRTGQGSSLELPREAGLYRVVADLGGQLVERSFSVRAFARQDHDLALNLARLDLSLSNAKAVTGLTEALLVTLESRAFAQEVRLSDTAGQSLYLPAGDYRLSTTVGLTPWTVEQSLTAGETKALAVDIAAVPVGLDLVAGERDKPLGDQVAWSIRDARNPASALRFTGPAADVLLAPGVYDMQVAFEGFEATQALFIDAQGPVTERRREQVRFNDGAVRLAFSNNGDRVPESLDLAWRIELGGSAIVTSQTLKGDVVQLPAGGYHLRATANDVEIKRDFLVLAGQLTELAPDFSLGQVTLRLIGASGDLIGDDQIDWSIQPQGQSASVDGFTGSARTGRAVQTLLLPEGRYRVTAKTAQTAIQRLISVTSGNKASFGLIVPAETSDGSLAGLGLVE